MAKIILRAHGGNATKRDVLSLVQEELGCSVQKRLRDEQAAHTAQG